MEVDWLIICSITLIKMALKPDISLVKHFKENSTCNQKSFALFWNIEKKFANFGGSGEPQKWVTVILRLFT